MTKSQDNSSIFRTVSLLADLLRKSGSQILTDSDSRSSLSLTWTVYQNVSKALAMFNNQPEECHKELNIKLVLDLEYLTSFLSRVPALKLSQTRGRADGDRGRHENLIHLGVLSKLTCLHMERIPVDSIQDPVILRSQLQSLTLQRCDFVALDKLLSTCLDSTPTCDTWSRLTTLCVTQCKLNSLSSALRLAPNITHLDCSNNNLIDTTGLENLSHLTHLNLSFNKLTYVPVTHESALLTHLLLAYNHIDQILSVSDLVYLSHLDLSGNCLMHHDALAPVSSLSKLLFIDLRHNPLSTHPRHRFIASSWLHSSLASATPSLDKIPLSRSESLQIGSSRLIISPSVSPARPLSENNEANNSTLDDIPDSVSNAGSKEGSLVSGYTVSTSGRLRKKKKGKKVREVAISDEIEYTSTETESIVENNKKKHENVDEISRLSDIRSKFGDNWLSNKTSRNSETLETLLGIAPDIIKDQTIEVDINRPLSKSENAILEDSLLVHNLQYRELNSVSRRLSDEIPDAIDTADDDNKDIKKEKGHENTLKVDQANQSRISTSSNPDQSFYTMYADRKREKSPGLENICKVNVLRSIPGDDSGLLEELVLVIDKDFIREQDGKGITRIKWFLHSLEQMEMIGRVERNLQSQHVGGDVVRCSMLFNTVRKDSREREYHVSEAGYSIIMSRLGSVLEAAAQVSSASISLQCVKCQFVFTVPRASSVNKESRCPKCGSDMVLETEIDKTNTEEEEEVSLGIPACEMLDLNVMVEADETSGGESLNYSSSPVEGSFIGHPSPTGSLKTNSSASGVSLSVKADIHNHTVNSPDNLPDLLPRPEPRRSSTPSSNPDHKDHSKEKSSSPALTRSDSSSDISVLSNPSECSIEVIANTQKQELQIDNLLVPAPPVTKTSAVSPMLTLDGSPASVELRKHMQESSDSDNMVTSVVASDKCASVPPESSPMVTPESSPSKRTPHDTTITPPSSAYSSTQTSPVKKPRDSTALDLDNTSLFYSCQEDETDTSHEETHDETTEDTNVTVVSPETPPESPVPIVEISPIDWSFDNYGKADHRVQLYCELSLFREEEDLLMLVKGQVYVKSLPGKMFPGVIVVSDKRIYILSINGKETEEPSDWLEQVTYCDILRLNKVVGMLGGQGVSFEISGTSKTSGQTFYRIPGTYSVDDSDIYHLVLCDRQRMERMVDMLVEQLQERVRSTPIPVLWNMVTEQEEVINKQLENVTNGDNIELFSMAEMVDENLDVWKNVSIFITTNYFIITESFFSWMLTKKICKDRQLDILAAHKLEKLENMSIYQSWLERISLDFESGSRIRLKLITETGVQELVRMIRIPWEKTRGIKLEEVTKFHLQGSKDVVTMVSLMMDDSVSAEAFDLEQWIKVTSCGREKRS